MNIAEIKRKIEENTAEIIRQTKINSFDLKRFHGADCNAGEATNFTLTAKAFDIIVAIHIGALAYFKEKHGADGIVLRKNKVVEVEFKTSSRMITNENAFRTINGAIYVTSPKNKLLNSIKHSKVACLASSFVAAFDVRYEENLKSKCRDTFLIAFDESNDSIIDCFELDGDTVVEYLGSSNSIKMGTFIKYGKRVNLVSGKAVGFEKWKESLLSVLPLKSTYQ